MARNFGSTPKFRSHEVVRMLCCCVNDGERVDRVFDPLGATSEGTEHDGGNAFCRRVVGRRMGTHCFVKSDVGRRRFRIGAGRE